MWLINTDTLKLEWFMGQESAPEYAILSHTWLDGEVSFQDYADPEHAHTKPGFHKIKLTCTEAKQAGIRYAWVDTCCIDKTSSAELTEAINSMFQWYGASKVCYVYLPDLDPSVSVNAMADCRWFTRGWTLQELIAPRKVLFYDSSWTLRGTKASLAKELSLITGVGEDVLHNGTLGILSTIPVAQRMAWAARRTTTRLEDIAYCLLGIFDVNMPMLYGEGEKAFIRLQEEIIKETNDLTLFAWEATNRHEPPQKYRGILARSPAEFANSSAILSVDDSRFGDEFTMTNKGVRVNVGLIASKGDYIMPLNCHRGDSSDSKDKELLGISLKKYGAGVFARANPESLAVIPPGNPDVPTIAFISKRMSPEQSASLDRNHRDAIVLGPTFNGGDWKPSVLEPADLFDKKSQMFLTSGMSSFFGFAFMAPQKAMVARGMTTCYILIGFGIRGSVPWATLCTPRTNGPAFSALKDLKKLGEIMGKVTDEEVELHDKSGKPKMLASVAFDRVIVEGEPVHRLEICTRDMAPE